MISICGLNKTTLLDYPGHVAATVFLGGCNFRCPFCHNGGLVLNPNNEEMLSEEEVLTFLKKRKGILTGVCISGGEPTLEAELASFISKIKSLGYLVKLDTNGYNPDIVNSFIADQLVDYIAMDIKNCFPKYAETAGVKQLDIEKIKHSIKIMMTSEIEYEFRTTVVKELHAKEDMLAIAKEIKGARAYFLQGYKESEQVISPGFHAYSKKEMQELEEAVKPWVPSVLLRGID